MKDVFHIIAKSKKFFYGLHLRDLHVELYMLQFKFSNFTLGEGQFTWKFAPFVEGKVTAGGEIPDIPAMITCGLESVNYA